MRLVWLCMTGLMILPISILNSQFSVLNDLSSNYMYCACWMLVFFNMWWLPAETTRPIRTWLWAKGCWSSGSFLFIRCRIFISILPISGLSWRSANCSTIGVVQCHSHTIKPVKDHRHLFPLQLLHRLLILGHHRHHRSQLVQLHSPLHRLKLLLMKISLASHLQYLHELWMEISYRNGHG